VAYVAPFDETVIRFFGQFAARDVAFDQLVRDVADSDLLKGGLFMAYFWWMWLRTDDRVEARRQRVLVWIAGALLAVVISRIAQRVLPFHPRPLHAGDPFFVLPYGVDPATLSRWNSLPSDHAALFFALALAVWYESKPLGLFAMIWTVIVICIPRIYLGFHYPSDILAGIALGAVIMAAAHHWLGRTTLPARVLRWEARHHGAFYAIAFLTTYEITILFYDLRQLAGDSFILLHTTVLAHA